MLDCCRTGLGGLAFKPHNGEVLKSTMKISASFVLLVSLIMDTCPTSSAQSPGAGTSKHSSSDATTTSAPPAVAAKDKVFSPDRKFYAFIETSKQTVVAANGDVPADVIWLGSNNQTPRPLFKRGATYKTNKPLGEIPFGGISDLCFASDDSELFFINAAYAVSGIVLAVDLKTNKIRDVIDANSLTIPRTGRWKNMLLVQRHKYNDQGAYNVECVVTPAGKEIKELRRVDN